MFTCVYACFHSYLSILLAEVFGWLLHILTLYYPVNRHKREHFWSWKFSCIIKHSSTLVKFSFSFETTFRQHFRTFFILYCTHRFDLSQISDSSSLISFLMGSGIEIRGTITMYVCVCVCVCVSGWPLLYWWSDCTYLYWEQKCTAKYTDEKLVFWGYTA